MKLRNMMTVLALGASMPALADNVVLNGFKYNSSVKTATISVNGTSIGPVYAGEYQGTLDGQAFSTFCTDVYQSLSFVPTSYPYERLTSDQTKQLWENALYPGTSYNPGSYSLVSKLFTTAYSSVNNSTTSAAFQYALWELLYEKTGTYAIGNGNFMLTNTDTNATIQATNWLTTVTGANASEGYVIQSLYSGNRQDLVIATPVPEPQTYALALVSLGIVAGYARRKRDKA